METEVQKIHLPTALLLFSRWAFSWLQIISGWCLKKLWTKFVDGKIFDFFPLVHYSLETWILLQILLGKCHSTLGWFFLRSWKIVNIISQAHPIGNSTGKHKYKQECIPVGWVPTAAVTATRCHYPGGSSQSPWGRSGGVLHPWCPINAPGCRPPRGGHGTGKTGNLVLIFSRQGKHREFCCDTGKIFVTQGKYFILAQGEI